MPPTASDRNDEERKRAKSQFMEEIAKIYPYMYDVPEHLSKAPSWMKSDRDIVLAAVKRDGFALEHASNELKADRDIVMAAVKQEGSALNEGSVVRYASKALKANRDFMIEVVKQNGSAVKHASKVLKTDHDFMIEAVKQDRDALVHASKVLKADHDFMIEAVKQDRDALVHASEALTADRGFMMEAVKQKGFALQHASYELTADRGVVIAAVKQNGSALQHASYELTADRGVAMAAVKQDVSALKYASDKLIADRNFVVAAVASEVEKQNKSLKESVDAQAKQIQELEVALASSRPIESVDLTQEENEEGLKPSKRARIDEKSDHPKSSLAMLSEMSTKMVKIKEEARNSIRIAEKKKDEAEFGLGECPICFEIREEAIALIPCGHVMCFECANKCVAEDCPTCHTRVESHLRLHK